MEGVIDQQVNLERASQAGAVGAETIAVGCPFCQNMLSDAVKSDEVESVKTIKDVAEIVWDALKESHETDDVQGTST